MQVIIKANRPTQRTYGGFIQSATNIQIEEVHLKEIPH